MAPTPLDPTTELARAILSRQIAMHATLTDIWAATLIMASREQFSPEMAHELRAVTARLLAAIPEPEPAPTPPKEPII